MALRLRFIRRHLRRRDNRGGRDGDEGKEVEMLIHGNSQFIGLKDNSVHCCVTSIPYWNLRCYNLDPVVFGGERDCQHQWGESIINPGLTGGTNQGSKSDNKDGCTYQPVPLTKSQFCHLCGAWRGELGLEPTPSLFVAHIVAIFREVKRVLHPSGVCWVNVGDTYSTAQNGRSAAATKAAGNDDRTFRDKPFSSVGVEGIKNKDLCGIPWRVAFGLQDDGWYLRSDIIWAKPNPMPESITDRPTKSHEYLFLLAKNERYFYDAEAVREETAGYERQGGTATYTANGFHTNGIGSKSLHQMSTIGRNRRSVWSIATQPYSGAHYATFPVKLVEPCILAGTSARGVCPKCGAPWKRETEKVKSSLPVSERNGRVGHNGTPPQQSGWFWDGPTAKPTGEWSPTCHCNAGDPVPSVVFDPFAGSGTVGEAARLHGRRFVGIDLNPSYLQINALPRAEKLTSEKAIMELPLFNLDTSINTR